MLSTELAEKLRQSRLALDRASSDNIIELCKQYLALLAACRVELYKLPDELRLGSSSSQSREDVAGIRKAVRAAIEHNTLERNRTEALLLSFTAVSGYEAAATLNVVKYQDRDTWELRAGGVGCKNSPGNKMSVQEAVAKASLLRREAHIAKTADLVNAHMPLDNQLANLIEHMKEAPDDSL
jgi:hypothetical protein